MATRIAIDAMGGDNAPGEIIRGAIKAAEDFSDIEMYLIGDEKAIESELNENNSGVIKSDFIFCLLFRDRGGPTTRLYYLLPIAYRLSFIVLTPIHTNSIFKSYHIYIRWGCSVI